LHVLSSCPFPRCFFLLLPLLVLPVLPLLLLLVLPLLPLVALLLAFVPFFFPFLPSSLLGRPLYFCVVPCARLRVSFTQSFIFSQSLTLWLAIDHCRKRRDREAPSVDWLQSLEALRGGQLAKQCTTVLRFTLPADTADKASFPCHPLLVRECYPRLRDAILAFKFPRFFLTGNSGIGKSCFLYYLAHHVLTVLKKPVVFYSFYSSTVAFLPVHGTVEEYDGSQRTLDTWSFYDAVAPHDYSVVGGGVVIAGSPGFLADARSLQRVLRAGAYKDIYMPAWSLKELQAGAALYSNATAKLALVPRLYSMWGGIPRYVLEFSENFGANRFDDPKAALDGAIGQFDLDQIHRIPALKHAGDLDMSFKVVHYDVNDQNFAVRRLRFGSKYITDRLVENCLQVDLSRLMWFLRSAAGQPALAGLRGDLFESFCHRMLREGGQFSCRPLSSTLSSGALELPRNDGITFHGLHEFSEPFVGLYCSPAYGHLAPVDAFMRLPGKLLLFQMTVSPEHQVKEAGLLQLFHALRKFNAADTIELYFVVPPDVFLTLPAQRYGRSQSTEDSPTNAQRLNARVKGIKQFALLMQLE
jgi:hypothetical protein